MLEKIKKHLGKIAIIFVNALIVIVGVQLIKLNEQKKQENLAKDSEAQNVSSGSVSEIADNNDQSQAGVMSADSAAGSTAATASATTGSSSVPADSTPVETVSAPVTAPATTAKTATVVPKQTPTVVTPTPAPAPAPKKKSSTKTKTS